MITLNEYRRVIGYSYLLYILFVIPIGLVHELGHIAVCSANGFNFDVWLDFRGAHSLCFDVAGYNQVMAIMGGLFGSLASLGILAIWYAYSKRHTPLAVASLALLLDQGSKILLEGFFPKLYSSGNLDLFVTILQIVSVALFAIYLTSRQKPGGSPLYAIGEERLDA